MSEYQFYMLKDPDDQVEQYDHLLFVWTPSGSFTYAVDKVAVSRESIVAFDRQGNMVTCFSPQLPWSTQPRNRSNAVSEDQMYERGLEREQVKKMREKRAESILGPQERPREY